MAKYTGEILAEAVAASRTMADVMRFLEIPLNGGAHAHLRRRILSLGIDTSHFLGQAHARGKPSGRRRAAHEVLVVRDQGRQRADPALLRRALMETGVPHQCASCGLGNSWNGRMLTLHVDHINGDFADCRAANLRFLCPNCHSQSATYAGRNRRKFGRAPAIPTEEPVAGIATTHDEIVAIISQVDSGALTVVRAARLIGCSRNHFYRIRARLEATGSALPLPRARGARSEVREAAILAYALEHPAKGPRKVAEGLRGALPHGWRVSHGTVSNVLRNAGLQNRAARQLAADACRMPSPA